MDPRSFLCEEAKIKQRTSSKKQLCEISEEVIWESRCTSFFVSSEFFDFSEFTRIVQKFFGNFTIAKFIIYEIFKNLKLLHFLIHRTAL